MKLQNLSELALQAQQNFKSYSKQEIILSPEFKKDFADFLTKRNETIQYSQYTSVIETFSGLTITFPNQWFYIASYFVKYLIALKIYKQHFNAIFQGISDFKGITKQSKESSELPDDIEIRIDNNFDDLTDRKYFKKFLSEYNWWFGNKTIDRGDFYVSPILSLAKVVNASQSYIAELTYYLSEDNSLLQSLRKSKVSDTLTQEQDKDDEVIQENSSIRDFALGVFNYFYKDNWQDFFDHTKVKYSKLNSNNFISHDFDSFIRLIGEYPSAQTKESLSSAGILRFFENPIYQTDERYFYFSTQWAGIGDESLSFQNLQTYFENRYPEYKFEKTGTSYKLIKKGSLFFIPFNYKFFQNKIEEAGLIFNERTIVRLIASLCTKPFVICSGLSGSGKTKLAQSFVQWICENKEQYEIVTVGADWTNREPLLGFPNALQSGEYVKPDNRVLDLLIEASKNNSKPYFIILDEMNLSHVERYFADFLSVMESHEKISLHTGNEKWNNIPSFINLPQNLFIIGTVNIDETTYMFSPKVLDRANVIEFRVTIKEMEDYLNNRTTSNFNSLQAAGAGMAKAFIDISNDNNIEPVDSDDLNAALLTFFDELKKTGSEFGYRSALEILRFAAVINKIASGWTISEIIDSAVMQKLLPKVHGSRRKLEPVLKTLGSLCLQNGQSIDEFISLKTDIDFEDNTKIKYPISLEKILRMYQNLISNGFVSYAEA